VNATRHFAHVNGVRLRYVESGGGPPVVFLHGFPDFSYSWRHQFPKLTEAGFRCIAPDLRGYNESDKPRRVRDYAIGQLVADVAELIAKVGDGAAHLVGHDWGGIIAWHLAMREPQRVRKLVILNAPHPALFQRELRKGPQALRSWYAGFFQLPFVPELVLSSFHFGLVTRGAARTEQEREIYEEALSQPRGLTSALNYYRAAFRSMVSRSAPSATQPINHKTLVLWGERDRALDQRVLDGLERNVPGVEVIRFRDIGHWIHIDAPERVNEELLRFLKS